MWPMMLKRTASGEPEYLVGSPAPPANNGHSGNTWHWRVVDRIVRHLQRSGFRNIRVDQQQVRGGKIVGVNRPDIQAVDPRGRRVIIEVDTNRKESTAHQRTVTALDPLARSVFLRIDPVSGRAVDRSIYTPRARSPLSHRRGPFQLADVLPAARRRPRRRRRQPELFLEMLG